MFTIIYLCTQCVLVEKWYEVTDSLGRTREFRTIDEAARFAVSVAKWRRTVCRVVDVNGVVAGETPDFRRAR